MFSAKKALLAGASLFVAAGLAYSTPAIAQGDADDFMKLQENLNGAVSSDETAAPVAADAIESQEQAETPAPVVETNDAVETAAEETVHLDPNDPDFLSKISALQKAITLKNLELTLQQKQSELDKLSGAAAAREAALQAEIEAARSGSNDSQSANAGDPVDNPDTLPSVAAVMGSKGKLKVELTFATGGSLTAKVGDMLPGGWKLTRIEDNAVYVKSDRTGTEFVLGSASAPAVQAVAPAPVPATPAPAPASESAAPAEGDSDIILAPAN